MKLQFPDSSRRQSRASANGFTLPEILIALTIFMFVVAGIVTANLFGLRMVQTNQVKLNISQWSRDTFGKITAEIHSCNSVIVGNFNTTNAQFEYLLDGEAQQGNALLIYPTTDTNSYITYFVNPSDETFRRMENLPNGTNTFILAYAVTNSLIFSAEDFSGNVQTNIENNRVIHLTLEMYQPEGFMQDSDYYKLETSVTRRALQ